MKLKHRDELKEKGKTLQYMVYGLGALTIVTIGLMYFAAKIYQGRTVIVTIPPGIEGQKTLVLGVNHSSPDTYGVFGQYFADLVGNFSYRNIDDAVKQLLKFYAFNLQHKEFTHLQKTAQVIKENYITQKFIPQSYNVKIDRRGIATVYVNGLLTRSIGKISEIVDFPYAYEFALMTYNANIYIVKPIKAGFVANTMNERNILKRYRETNKYLDFNEPLPQAGSKNKEGGKS